MSDFFVWIIVVFFIWIILFYGMFYKSIQKKEIFVFDLFVIIFIGKFIYNVFDVFLFFFDVRIYIIDILLEIENRQIFGIDLIFNIREKLVGYVKNYKIIFNRRYLYRKC